MTFCIVEKETSEYQSKIDISDLTDDAVKKYAEGEMKDHLCLDNISEAIGNMSQDDFEDYETEKERGAAAVGQWIITHSHGYWQRKAEEEAEKQRDDISGAMNE